MASLVKLAIYGVLFAVAMYLLRQYNKGRVCESKARLDNKVAIITGGNTGIGKQTAIDFLQRGAKVMLACRSMQRAEAAAEDILNITKASKDKLVLMKLDLASMKSIRQFAKDFKSKESRLDILMNNAGVMINPYEKTEDGFESQFGVNHLGHFLLTNLLSDILVKSAPSRVVTVSSMAHWGYGSTLNFEKLMPDEEDYSKVASYSQAKLANVLFSKELGAKLQGTGVTTYSLHPGAVETDLQRYIPGMNNDFGKMVIRTVMWPFMKEVEYGAQTQICCAVDERLAKETGKYYSDVQEAPPSAEAQSDEDAKKLWELSVQLVQLKPEETHPKLR